MGNVDQPRARGAQPIENAEQDLGFRIGQRGGRLVEHENPGIARQRLCDFDEVLLADAEVAGRKVRIELQMEVVEHALCAAVETLRVDESEPARLASEKNGFG